MNKERLSRLITQYQKNLEFYRNAREFNEQDCRDEFISPLLESFGWDVHNEKGTSPQYKEVVVEKFSNSGDRPDYTLTLNGVSKIFVEAKKPAVNIKEESEPAIQARRYGWNAKHKLSILTNFEDMMIYDVTNKPQDGDAATVSLYRKYHYLEYLKKYEEIYELISRESVYTGKYDEYVEEKFPSEDRYSTEVDEVFLKQINEWRLEIGDYLYHMDSTYRDIEFLNDVVQEFINQIIFLGEIVNIFNGIQTSAERPKPVYWFSKDEIVSEKEDEIIVDKFEKRYHIEKSILKPFFKPTKADEKGMGTYSILKTDKYIIFPYNADGSLISIDVMKKEYPGTYQYLEDCYELLVPKCLNGGKGRDIKNATADTWYQYGRTQAITAFVNTPKLIVRILSKDPMYAYDENNMLIASGGTAGYCAISKLPDSKYDLRYIQAWLNHPYTEKLFQIMGSDFEGGFTARGTYLLKKIPFVELDFNDKIQKALYESVLVSVKRIRELNNVLEQKKDKASVGVIEAEKENLSKRIEDDITKIYNLQF